MLLCGYYLYLLVFMNTMEVVTCYMYFLEENWMLWCSLTPYKSILDFILYQISPNIYQISEELKL